MPFSTLNPTNASSLEIPFREEKVFITLNEMEGDKALGPDGFTIAF